MNQRHQETVSRLRKFSNSYTFAKVMGSNPDLCKQVIERILGMQIKDIEMLEGEASILRIEGKSIFCDVLAANSDSYFQVEMQTYNQHDLGKRIHYYDSSITTRSSEKGMKYGDFLPRYIIFICTCDPFTRGLSMYPFDVTCSRDREIVLDTGTHILILNTSTLEEELSCDLENFFAYVQNGSINKSDDLIVDLDNAIINALRDEEWVSTVNRLDWEIELAENRGREEALEKGRQEGLEQGRIQEIRALVADGILTEQQAAERIKCIQEQSDKM